MNRVGFTLKVKPERMDEYRRRHAEVWPEMLDALRGLGWQNYTLFLRDDGTLFGYFETPGSFEQALAAMGETAVNERWQREMAGFFDGEGRPADQTMMRLDEVFHLD